MSQDPSFDGVLIQWGDRLFYPGNRVVKVKPQPKLAGGAARQRAVDIRERIEATAEGLRRGGELELVSDPVGDTYRAVYTVKFATAV